MQSSVVPPGPFQRRIQKLQDFELKRPTEEAFPWRHFTPIVLAVAVISLGVLAVLNAILVGYESVTVFRDNFNVSQSFWYDRLLPGGYGRSEPGTLCDPHGFNVGDTFTTNYSLFKWELVTVGYSTNNSHVGSFAYNGSTLETCDAIAIYMDAQMQSRSADLAVAISCKDVGGFNILATTSFSVTLLKGKYSPPLLGANPEKLGSNDTGTGDTSRSSVLNHMMQLARDDFTPLWDAFLQAPVNHPIIMSGNAEVVPCPASRDPSDPCATHPPDITIIGTTIVWSNASHSTFDVNEPGLSTPLIPIGTDIYLGTLNLAQTILATVRIDLGNTIPNNFFINSSALNETLSSKLNPMLPPSTLYHAAQSMQSLTMNGSANIQVLYSCPKWQQKKSIGYAIVSVLVATLSMFSTGWAILMFVAGLLAERKGYQKVMETHIAP
ncbi:hypothetical protein FPV67DRAFT_340304 [Lyophyllum atratum]|nr:hypothetical protein FPV67DRAFT_340304 [Lyophyllum atratum]